jgi:hypothetical protein
MLLRLKFGFFESKNGSVKDRKVYDWDTEVGTYTGEIKDGWMHGQGELTLNQDGKVFLGKFATDRIRTGKLTDKNFYYEGEFIGFEPEGKGSYFWRESNEYHGEFKDGKKHGLGKYIQKEYLNMGKDPITIEGNFENGEPSGKCLAVYANGTVYDGEFVNGERQGFGICKYKDGKGKNYDGSDYIFGNDYQGEEGFTYEGEWYQNKRHGKGKLKDAEGTIILEGIWENNQIKNNQIKNGTGKKTYDNGDVYDGELKDGKHHGKGKYTFATGSIYDGDWEDGKRTGYGKMKWGIDGTKYPVKKGYTYEGQWQVDLFSGQGVLRNEAGEIIAEGIWENNQIKNGFGKKTHENGDIYDGELKDGEPNGKGTYTFADGRFYNGQWKDGLKSVKGTFTWPDGHVYNGEWNEDERHGFGKMTWADGAFYEGDFKDGLQSGKGTYTWANADVYEGEWKEDKKHGFGKKTYADGDVYDGEWEDDCHHGKGKYTFANGDIYDGEWDVNCQHGKGKMTYKNDTFECFGSWSYGRFHGLGKNIALIENTDPSYDPIIHNFKKEEGFFYLGYLIKGTRQYFDGRNEEGIFIPDMLEIEIDDTVICLNNKINEYIEQNHFQSAIDLCEKVINIKFNDSDYWKLLGDEHIYNKDECIFFPYDLNANEFKESDEDIDLKPELLVLIEEIKNKQLQNTIQSFDFSNQKSEEKNNNAHDFDDFA